MAAAGGDLAPRRARALVARIVADVFDDKPRRVKRLGEGLTNAVFEFAVGPDTWVVRLNADPDKADAFTKEHWAMARARRAGVPTPRVLRVGRGPGDVAWMVVASARGQPATRVGKRLPLLAQMGRCAARLHRIATRGYGSAFDPAEERWTGHARWGGYLDDALDASERVDILRRQHVLHDASIDELRESLAAMRRWRRAPVLQHGDLRLKNVIADDDGERIVAIIDWEQCVSAPGPYWDLSIALHDLGIDEKEVFLDGYGMSAREFADAARFVRALNLLNYAWAIGEATREKDERRLAWLRLRLKGGFDITA